MNNGYGSIAKGGNSNLARGSVKRQFNARATVDGRQEKVTFSSDGGYTLEIFNRNRRGNRELAFTIVAGEVDLNSGDYSIQIYNGKPEDADLIVEAVSTGMFSYKNFPREAEIRSDFEKESEGKTFSPEDEGASLEEQEVTD